MSELLGGRYALGPVIGTGGMARVHAAHDQLLDRPVAVKLATERFGEQDRQRLEREARTAARFQHGNAVAVYDVGEHDGQPFVVMELVDGENLADRLRRVGRLSEEETVAVLESVLLALEAAHAAGLVHRDVKPGNVLLPADGPPKLADFGIAKQVWGRSDAVTRTGNVLGTPTYVAPEQAAGAEPTAAVDIYACGVVAFELLAGEPPFRRDTPLATALAHQHDPVPSLRAAAPHVSAGLAAAVEHALAKDPGDRFRSAAEMRAALRQPAAANGPAAGGRWILPAGLGAAVLLAALGLGLSAWSPGTDDPEPDPGPGPAEPSRDEEAADTRGEGNAADAQAGEGASDEGSEPDDSEPGEGERDDAEAPPASLRELAALVAADPDAAGERADDLIDELLEVAREDDEEDQREDARELIRDVARWQAEGALDQDVAALAVDLLEPVGRPEAAELAPVSAALAALATRPGGGGEKYEDALDALEGILDEDGPEGWADEARSLEEDLDDWEAAGEVDAEVAQAVREVLAGL